MHRTYPEECVFYKLYDGDFIVAQNSIELLSDSKELRLKYILLRDIVISYARPFSINRGIEVSKHSLGSKFIPPKHKNLHNELIDLRDQLFAHTDLSYRKPKVADFSSGDHKWFPMSFKGFDYNCLLAKIDDIADLIKKVQESLRKEIFQIESKI